MPHAEASLIATIAISLAYAVVFGFIAVKLRLPAIIGYLAAGIAVGPFTPGFVANGRLAEDLAEIGVMLLMFGVGMHFSVRALMGVRNIAIGGAVAQVVASFAMTLALTHLWHWSLGAGIVMGLALSIASTVVFLRAMEARGMVQSDVGKIAVGWLVVEDLLTVLILLLLPVLAGVLGGHVPEDGTTTTSLALKLYLMLAKLAVFVGLMLVIGKRVLPWLLTQVARTGSRELSILATPPAGRYLILAGAIGSIALNALAFRIADRLAKSIKPSAAGVVLSQPSSVSASPA